MKTHLLFYAFSLFIAFTAQAQITQLNNNNNLEIIVPLGNNKTIASSDSDSSIWVTDGTPGGTIQLSPDIKYEEAGGLISGKFVFRGSIDTTGSEIYITDGTSSGTVLVKDIVDGAAGSDPGDMAFLNGIVYFSATTALEGRELWRTNGTAAGTNMVKDILPGAGSSNDIDSFNVFSNGTFLLFAARNTTSGIELWKSDGTSDGTILLKDINLNPLANLSSSKPDFFIKNNGLVLFIATDTARGREVWKTDGTPSGTVIVKDINPGTANSTTGLIEFIPGFFGTTNVFDGFHLFNNKIYFRANDGSGNGTSNGQLWVSDGADAALLKDVLPGISLSAIFLFNAINLPGKFIFPVSDFENRFELWESDGTPGGTKLFKAFFPDEPDLPLILLSYNFDFSNQILTQPLFQGNKFFFSATDSAQGRELWISDGTLANTNIVKDINPNSANGINDDFPSYVYTSTALYFAANDSSHGTELWKSDGTNVGTTMIADINPDAADSDPELPFFIANGKIIFSATDGDDPDSTDLYVVDGSFDPLPVRLSQFTVMLKAKDALVQWTTLNEINVKNFTIQRSYDGQHFEDIASVPAVNNFSVKHDYSFNDAGVGNRGKSIIYYRILARDKDGKSESTSIISVKFSGNNKWMVRLISNPVQNYLSLRLNDIVGELNLSIKDMSGKTVFANSRRNINGQITIPVADFQRGMYILIAENNNERKVIQFIKQ